MINFQMPDDVQEYVSKYQGDMKVANKTRIYSQPDAINAIIREHKNLKEDYEKLKKAYDTLASRLAALEDDSAA